MTEPWDYDWDDWVEPGYPMTGPAFDWSTIRYITIHYPGAPAVLPLSVESERAEIRAEQRMYLRKTPPYSLGYNAKVFQNGHRWKLRGDVLRCAANGSQATNVPGFAIQIRVANDEQPTDDLIAAVRSIVAWAREKSGRHLPINGHRDLKATACPGDRAYALIQAGVFEPVAAPVVVEPPVVPPPFIPPSEEDDMSYLFKLASGDYGLRGPSGSRRVSGEELDAGKVGTRESAWQVPSGSNTEYWIVRELDAYDRSLGAS